MITTPTTFVIGAGASHTAGFPLGGGLLDQVRRIESISDVYQILVAAQDGDHDSVDAMLRDLQTYRGPSIDAFLENHTRHRTIGRKTLAVMMAKAAEQRRPPEPTEDWLGFVLEHMRRGTRDRWEDFVIGNANLRFVVFNFDTTIEDRIVDFVVGTYSGVTEDEVRTKINLTDVIHVHGWLPHRPIQLTADWVNAVAENYIRVIHDELNIAVLSSARHVLRTSAIVCFLGFAYHQENLDTLDVPHVLHPRTEVFGTTLGLAASDKSDLRRRIDPYVYNEMILEDKTCLAFLESNDVVRTVTPSEMTRWNRYLRGRPNSVDRY